MTACPEGTGEHPWLGWTILIGSAVLATFVAIVVARRSLRATTPGRKIVGIAAAMLAWLLILAVGAAALVYLILNCF